MPRRLICAIVGRRVLSLPRDAEVESLAEGAGRAAVAAGFSVLTGGKEGAMLAASRAAQQAGGTVIALLPNNEHAAVVGDHYEFVLPTPIGIVRNALTASMCDVMVAVPGGSGTLEEILFATDFGKPVIQYSHWLHLNTVTIPSVADYGSLVSWLRSHT